MGLQEILNTRKQPFPDPRYVPPAPEKIIRDVREIEVIYELVTGK